MFIVGSLVLCVAFSLISSEDGSSSAGADARIEAVYSLRDYRPEDQDTITSMYGNYVTPHVEQLHDLIGQLGKGMQCFVLEEKPAAIIRAFAFFNPRGLRTSGKSLVTDPLIECCVAESPDAGTKMGKILATRLLEQILLRKVCEELSGLKYTEVYASDTGDDAWKKRATAAFKALGFVFVSDGFYRKTLSQSLASVVGAAKNAQLK